MTTTNEVVSFLCAMPEETISPTSCTVIETHLSVVVLKGERAFKIKKNVQLPYANFSSAELRLLSCQNEVALNRRTAPELYKAAHKITRTPDGRLSIGEPGALVDAVVEMRRFPDHQLWDAMAIRGEINAPLADAVAHEIAELHQKAAATLVPDGYRRIANVLDLNEQSNPLTESVLEPGQLHEIQSTLRTAAQQLSALLDQRGLQGKVRRCHGDLHLRNICMFNGRPTLFDCIEFNDDLATIDTLYDLAFLLMDLWRCGLPHWANRIMNRYLDATDDLQGLPLLPFFMALRATIRAQVLATQAALNVSSGQCTPIPDPAFQQQKDHDHQHILLQANEYLHLARQLLKPAHPVLAGIGGFSGSGKSTLANALACHTGPVPGARVISSDRLRKKLFDVPATQRLAPHAYTAQVSKQVYDTLIDQARAVLKTGHSAIADAVFGHELARKKLRDCALELGVPFAGIWLQAPAPVLLNRVAARINDPSDATPDVVKKQLSGQTGPLDWTILASNDPMQTLVDCAITVLKTACHDAQRST